MIPKEWLQYAPKPKPVNDEEWNVFLSYSSVNRSWALNLYDFLSELGYKVFLDQYVVKGGDNFNKVLEDALEKSQAGILIWSNIEQDFDWLRKEYNKMESISAVNDNFRFIPITIEPSKLSPFAANKIFIDYSEFPGGPDGGNLLRLLYTIAGAPLTNEAFHFSNEQDEFAKAQINKVNELIKNGDPEKLKQIMEKDILPRMTNSILGCRVATALVKMKRYDDALEILDKIKRQFKKALRPLQINAMALVRRNNIDDLEIALEILKGLHEKNQLDPETIGIYGKVWMNRYEISKDIKDLQQSRDLNAEGFEKAPDNYYLGISAAEKSVFIGTENDLKRAADYAIKVQRITGNAPILGDCWKTAIIGEAYLIQKKYHEAAEIYAKSVDMAKEEKGFNAAIRVQVKRLMENLKPGVEDREIIEKIFSQLPKKGLIKKAKIFISYSHIDIILHEELVKYLTNLEQSGVIELLLESTINKDDYWEIINDRYIYEADIILVLVSPDYILNKNHNKEVALAIEQFDKGQNLVIPILLRDCDLNDTPLLKVLFLSYNYIPIARLRDRLAWYPEFIKYLERLTAEMGEEYFEKIRPEIIHKSGALDLSKSNITNIPRIVTKMTWLQSVNLSNNRIENLRPLEALDNLVTLDVSFNYIQDIGVIYNLVNLNFIDLSYNRISKISGFNKQLSIESIKIENNMLEVLPDLTSFVKLKRLDVSNNKLTETNGIGNLKNLFYLNISNNKIRKMAGFEKLTQLKELSLVGNEIQKIDGLGSLTNLEILDLYRNEIKEVEGLENNIRLRILGLSNNKIEKLENIKHLKELQKIYAAHNSIQKVDELKDIKSLKRIVLTENKIIDISPLEYFIENDIIVRTSYSFDPEESGIFVGDNPIQYPPLEVLLKGKDAILRNFKQQRDALEEALQPYQSNDIKLILIGNANVGKTHIATYIKSKRRRLPLDNASTHGMVNMLVNYQSPAFVKMRILDFGGQEYYHDTHHLFFTTDTIYLLLWEKETNKFGLRKEMRYSRRSGKDEEETNAIFPIAYWLDAVNYFINKREEERKGSLTPDSEELNSPIVEVGLDPTVILVETKRNRKGSTLLDTSSILAYKDIIHSQVSISLYLDEKGNINSTGIDALFDNLNNLMGSIFEKKWSGYYKLIVVFFEKINSQDNRRLLKMANAENLIINFQTCLELFNRIIDTNNYNYKFDYENGLDLCRFLANRGYILYFDSDKICLKPDELTKEIYSVLNSEYNNIGVIKDAEISAAKDVINIMQEFKLLVRHPDGNSFIAPQLLPENINSQLNMFLDAFKPPFMRFAISGYIHKNIIQELFYSFREKLLKEDTQNYIWKNGFIVKIKDELYKISISSNDSNRFICIQYLNHLNVEVLAEIKMIISAVLKGRKFEIEVSKDGFNFVSINSLQENIRLSQFVSGGKLVRIADYRNYLEPDLVNYSMKKLFISYSSKNSAFMKRFVTHLEPLKRNGAIDFWHDRMIEPGTKWDDTIKNEMEHSNIIVFLLSPDFIATNYIFEVEIPKALEQITGQENSSKTKLFFVELQPCGWGKTILSKYQLPTNPNGNNKEVITINNPENDTNWQLVIAELEKLLN